MTSIPCGIVPAAPPPLGVTSNFRNPDSDAPYFTLVCFPLLGLSALLVLLRLYTRGFILRKVGSDDYLMVIALLFCGASTATSQVQVRYGLGKHAWDVPLRIATPNFLRLLNIATLTYFMSMFFIKLSLLFMYRRNIGSNRTLRLTWWITLATVVLYNVPCVLIIALGCRPISATWDPRFFEGAKCINQTITLLVQGSFNAFTDLMILILALMIIRTLKLTRQQRLILTVLFVIGSLTCVVSVYRLTRFIPLTAPPAVFDFTYDALSPTIWSLVEINSGIVCGSFITLRPLLRKNDSLPWTAEVAESDKYKSDKSREVWKWSRGG